LVCCPDSTIIGLLRERVFAMANSSFDETQTSTLEDRREATVMIRMNNNWKKRTHKWEERIEEVGSSVGVPILDNL
jgi:hypothetical protein